LGLRRPTEPNAYRYPSSKAHWKKRRHVVQTAEVPPNHGRMILAIRGCTRNSRNALRKMTDAKIAGRVGNPFM
jgi:hypothetical protein